MKVSPHKVVAAALVATAASGNAVAQSVAVTVGTIPVSSPGFDLEHVSYDAIKSYPQYEPLRSQFSPVLSNSLVAGTLVLGDYNQVSTAAGVSRASFTVTVPCLSGGAASEEAARGEHYTPNRADTDFADPYQLRFFGEATPAGAQQAFLGYRSFLAGTLSAASGAVLSATADEFREDVYSCSVRSAENPLVGVGSVGARIVAGGLDFNAPTESDLTTGDQRMNEVPWGVGFGYARVVRRGRAGQQFDVAVARSWRILEGRRARLSVDVPISYQDFGGKRQVKGYAAVAVELPAARRWTLEPRAAYGLVDDNAYGLNGQIVSLSVTSRHLIDRLGFGSGRLLIGNMAGYSKVTSVKVLSRSLKQKTENFVLRNGVSYDEPLRLRLFGRNLSSRMSYTMTNFLGDDIYAPTMHEISGSFGVRSRGTQIRNSFEAFRIGTALQIAKTYRAGSLFVGYRF